MSKVVRLYKTKTKELICIFIAVLVLIPAEGIAILSPVIYQIIWGSSARTVSYTHLTLPTTSRV